MMLWIAVAGAETVVGVDVERIQDALDLGETEIVLAEGRYHEDVVIPRGEVSIVADGEVEWTGTERSLTVGREASVTLEGITFRNGGGVEVHGELLATEAAFEGLDRALRVSQFGEATTIDCVFADNTSDRRGAAVDIEGVYRDVRGVFERNIADDGGAVAARSDAQVRLERSHFASNSARYEGGAIDAVDSTLELEGVVFEDNAAAELGGDLRVDGSTIDLVEGLHCRSSAPEGGVLAADMAQATLSRTAMHGVEAPLGAAISALDGSVTLSHIHLVEVFGAGVSVGYGSLDASGSLFTSLSGPALHQEGSGHGQVSWSAIWDADLGDVGVGDGLLEAEPGLVNAAECSAEALMPTEHSPLIDAAPDGSDIGAYEVTDRVLSGGGAAPVKDSGCSTGGLVAGPVAIALLLCHSRRRKRVG